MTGLMQDKMIPSRIPRMSEYHEFFFYCGCSASLRGAFFATKQSRGETEIASQSALAMTGLSPV